MNATRNATATAAPRAAEPGVAPDTGVASRAWLRVAIALVIAGQGMAFSLAANQTPPETPLAFWLLHAGLALSALLVLVLLGGPLFRECVQALRAGRITVDLLFLVSLLGAFGASVLSTVRGQGPIFYELVAVLLAIYTVGRLLDARSRAQALRAVESLRAEHATCLRVAPEGDRRERVPVASVAPGDRVVVGPGETIAIDGVIRAGRGLVWTTPLTGEPDPVICGPGQAVFAGMRSVDGVLEIDVRAAAGARRLDTMLRAIEQARLAPSRLQSAADRLAARFVPVVLLVSVATFAFWLWRGPVVPAVEHSLAVLVVACPCALGLATPLGIWSALVQLGRYGLVARSGDFLDRLATAHAAFFDKTGTLFEPQLGVAAFTVLPGSAWSEAELRELLAAAETGIGHPIAETLATVAPVTGSRRFERSEAQIVPGAGVRARIRSVEGERIHDVLAGTSQLLRDAGIAVDRSPADAKENLRRIFVAVDRATVATIDLAEEPRARAAGVFAELQALGMRSEILTGDPSFAPAIWSEVPRATGLTPEAKAQRVQAAQAGGERVLFVGDGLNDAPALALADVAIALRHGADLARSNALALLAGESLGTLPAAVRLARRVRAAIRSNLRFAVAYNSVAMALAAAGWVHPVLAALLMAGSSAIVSTRVLRASSAAPAPPPPARAIVT